MIRNWIFGGLAIVFGLATVAEGGSVLLGSRSATAAAGNFVPLVLWVNFLSGFFYVLAGTGIVMVPPSGLFLTRGLAVVLLVLFGYFIFYVLLGGAWETRTLGAMILRLSFWAAVALLVKPRSKAARTA